MHTERHTFGGSALDRFIFDFEPTGDGDPGGGAAAVEAGGEPSPSAAADSSAGATGEPVSSTGVTDTPPAWTPEQIRELRDHPDLREWVSEEAAQIADARVGELEQYIRGFAANGGDGQGAPQFDANEFLNPLGDNYGANMITLLQHNQQQTLEAVKEMLSPFQQQSEQTEAAERDTLLRSTISDVAGRDGGLAGGDTAISRVMAAVRNTHFPELARRYGQTDRAAELAIDKALREEREYQKQIREAGLEQHTERVGALAAIHGEPGAGAGSGVVTIGDKPLSSRELALKYGGRAAAAARG